MMEDPFLTGLTNLAQEQQSPPPTASCSTFAPLSMLGTLALMSGAAMFPSHRTAGATLFAAAGLLMTWAYLPVLKVMTQALVSSGIPSDKIR